MGLYAVQAANLAAWDGSTDDPEWRKLIGAAQAKLAPRWTRSMMDALDAELVAERARRQDVERRDRTLREQIRKEVQASQELRRERDDARDEAAALKAHLAEAVAALRAHQPDRTRDEIASLAQRLEEAARQREKLDAQVSELSRQLASVETERRALAERNEAASHTIETLNRRLAAVESGSAPPPVSPVPPLRPMPRPEPARARWPDADASSAEPDKARNQLWPETTWGRGFRANARVYVAMAILFVAFVVALLWR
jgi:septal ring factor EnvC (AmiA/AmiB activator)